MKLKKIGILLLVLTFILHSFPINAAEEPKAELSYEARVLSTLGIMEIEKEYEPQMQITRVDFAKMVYNLLTFQDDKNSMGKWEFFGNEMSEQEEIVESNYIYSDVDEEIDGYSEIEFLTQIGIMIGVENGKFNPLDTITKKQAVMVMMRVLGYSVIENNVQDFDRYYNSLASKLKLIEQTDENITYSETARLIYNTMVSKSITMSINNEISEENELFMEKYMGLSYIMGTVTNTGFVSLKLGEVLNPDKVIINNSVELNKEKENQYAEYIGRTVNCFYYNENSDKEGQIAFIEKDGKNREIEIDAGCEPEFNRSSNSISYTEGNKSKNYYIGDNAVIIKNNQFLESYFEDDFAINSGSIRIVETAVGDVVIINSYKDFYVSGLNAEELKLYNGIKYAGETVLELENMVYRIVTQSGEEITIDKLKQGNVLSVCEGPEYTDIIVSEQGSIKDTVMSVSKTDGKIILTTAGEKEIVISKYYSSSTDAIVPEIRKEYYFHINVYGEAAYISEEDGFSADTVYYGYCWYVKESEDEDALYTKILTPKDVWQIFEFAPVFTAAMKDGSEKRINKYKKFLDFLNVDYNKTTYRGIIRYTLDENGKINYFELPITDTVSDKKGQLKYMGKAEKKTWIIDGETLAPNIIVGRDVKMIVQKPQRMDEDGNIIERTPEDYSMKKVDFINWTSVTLDAYTINGDSPKADFVIRTTSEKAADLTPENCNYAVALSDFSYIWDESENEELLVMDVMNCKSDGDKVSAAAEKFVFKDKAATIARDSFKDFGSNATYNISKGDIFRYAQDSDGKITETMLVWDESETNKIADTLPTGNIAGSIGYYSPSAGGFTNPFAIANNQLKVTDFGVDVPTTYRVIYGSVYKKYQGNTIRITTQPVKGGRSYDKSCSDTRFVDESICINNTNRIITVTISGNKVSAKSGSMNDIKSYEEYGSDCSRIVACYSLGVEKWAFIINGENLR